MIALTVLALTAVRPLLNGVDASFVPQYRDLKASFFEGTKPVDALEAFAKTGSKVLRLRVWLNPKDGYCSVARTLAMAKEGHKLGMKLMIDFHYADDWADPQHQPTPVAWQKMDLVQLSGAVRQHTESTLSQLAEQGTPADTVQVGNEIRNGTLWPLGKLQEGGFDNLATLLKAGIDGVRKSKGGKKIRVIIHHDQGGNLAGCTSFYSNLRQRGVRFDIIGLSYYPWWHGTLDALQQNLDGLAARFKVPVMVVETAYPFTLKWADNTGNFVGSDKQLLPGYPATPDGQAAYLRELNRIVRAVPNDRGVGVVYWAPEYVAQPGIETPCENLCLFDFEHRLLPGAAALGE